MGVLPDDAVTATLSYGFGGRSTSSLSARYISSGIYNKRYNLPTAPARTSTTTRSPSVIYLNLSGGYTWEVAGGTLELYANVQNLLDKDPPIVPSQFDTSPGPDGSEARPTPGCSTCSAGASRSACDSVIDGACAGAAGRVVAITAALLLLSACAGRSETNRR